MIQYKNKKTNKLYCHFSDPYLGQSENMAMLCQYQVLENVQLIMSSVENVQTLCKTNYGLDVNNLEFEQRIMVIKLSSLEYRRARGDMTETYKIIHSFIQRF